MTKSQSADIMIMLKLVEAFRELDEQLPPQTIAVLLNVALRPGQTMQELVEATGLGLSSISRNLMALGEWHRAGKPGLDLVETIDDPHERRRKIAFLTPKGRTVVRELLAIMNNGEAAKFESPTAREYLTRTYTQEHVRTATE